MNKRMYIYVNGILNMPSNCDAWTDRAVTWTIKKQWNMNCWSEKFEYFADVVFRRMFQQKRAEKLYKMIANHYNDWSIVLVGHSNGCDIIMRALDLLRFKKSIDEVHLFAPACPRYSLYDLRTMMLCNQVKDFVIYLSGNDEAMRLARLSLRLLSPFRLGYGDLGGMNPEEVEDVVGKNAVVFKKEYGHSTWWKDDEHFENSMQMIMRR